MLDATVIMFWYFVGIFLKFFDDFLLDCDWIWVSFSMKSDVDEVEAANTSKGLFKDLSTCTVMFEEISVPLNRHSFFILDNMFTTFSLLHPMVGRAVIDAWSWDTRYNQITISFNLTLLFWWIHCLLNGWYQNLLLFLYKLIEQCKHQHLMRLLLCQQLLT